MKQRIAYHPMKQSGFTLIELMVALVLGLIVVGAAGSLFLSNNRVYGMTETVGRIQENQRPSFELMARDIRSAGGTPCGTPLNSMTSVLNTTSNTDFAQYTKAIVGSANTKGDTVRLYSGISPDV